jgi:hypothetical protein
MPSLVHQVAISAWNKSLTLSLAQLTPGLDPPGWEGIGGTSMFGRSHHLDFAFTVPPQLLLLDQGKRRQMQQLAQLQLSIPALFWKWEIWKPSPSCGWTLGFGLNTCPL